MPISVTVPRLGWNMEEGTFIEWLKAEGETIRPGDSLFKLEGEKSVEEVECLDTGVLHIPANAPKPGDRVKVGAIIGYLLQPGETARDRYNRPPSKSRQSVVNRSPVPPCDGWRMSAASISGPSAVRDPAAGSARRT